MIIIFFIDTNINTRDLLYEVNEINYNPQINNYNEYHFDIKYINENTLILTLTKFITKEDTIYFTFNYKNNKNYLIIEKIILIKYHFYKIKLFI